MKKKLLLVLQLLIASIIYAQECTGFVNIPDANFKEVLLYLNNVIDTNGDGEISCEEAAAVTELDIFNGFLIEDISCLLYTSPSPRD